MALIRSLLFAAVFHAGTLVAVLLAIPAAFMGREPLRRLTRGWAIFHRWCAAHLLGIRTRIVGRLPQEPMLVAAKHQSMFETVELVVLLGVPAAVVKQELAQIPLWGWAARRYGVIPVDRDGGASALRRMVQAAEAAMAEGRPVLIFPEGTRVPPGEQPALQPGFAGLYRALGKPVVPVALDSGRLWPRHHIVKRAGMVTMRFGEPIPPGLPRKEIEARVHAAINALEAQGQPSRG
jgi:1-acyl-sn-glycerol-3-phosphate acyltransferase